MTTFPTFTCTTVGCVNEATTLPAFEYPKPGLLEGETFIPPTWCGACGNPMTLQPEEES